MLDISSKVAAEQPRNGIFFVTDGGFLLPTLACAQEVRAKVTRQQADLHIVTVGLEQDVLPPLHKWLSPLGIQISVLPETFLDEVNLDNINKTHVPHATLGRFFMLSGISNAYDRILYLDGDTWPAGNPAALLETALPEGFFAAAEDRSFYWRAEASRAGRSVRNYFTQLGIDGNAGYFNAGVLLASAATWRHLSAQAFTFFTEHTKTCLYHDQSALNAIAQNRRLRLNPKWNYLYDYYDWGIKPSDAPEIIHFCGQSKPWKLPDHPFFNVYQPTISALAEIGLSRFSQQTQSAVVTPKVSLLKNLKHVAVSRYRNIQRRRMFKQVVEHSTIG